MGGNTKKKNTARKGDTGSAKWGEVCLDFKHQGLGRPH